VAVAITPEVHREKVLVGLAAVRLSPVDPSGPAPALPADSVAINGTWGGDWVAIGSTEEGVTFTFSRSTENIMIEESEVPVDVRTTEVQMGVNAALAEDSFDSMKIAFGGGTITSTAATALLPGTQTLVISTELDQFALGLEGKNEFGLWRRILIPRVLSVADAQAQFRRAAAPRRWNVSFRSLVPITDCTIRQAVAPPTS
jgi:hypothetical protein